MLVEVQVLYFGMSCYQGNCLVYSCCVGRFGLQGSDLWCRRAEQSFVVSGNIRRKAIQTARRRGAADESADNAGGDAVPMAAAATALAMMNNASLMPTPRNLMIYVLSISMALGLESSSAVFPLWKGMSNSSTVGGKWCGMLCQILWELGIQPTKQLTFVSSVWRFNTKRIICHQCLEEGHQRWYS